MVDPSRLMIMSAPVSRTILLFLVLIGTAIQAQDRCGTVEYSKMLFEKNLIRDDTRKFEKWLSERKARITSRINTAATFKIPVVVHVIHKGEAPGSGSNISDAQIASQIKVLNNDFRRLNADTTETPADFLSVAGKINFEFVLARQSPDGLVTNGINRVKGTKNQWTLDDNEILKSLSYWPAEDYLNIWVTDIASTILGYAQFPVSDLPGLENAENNRLTDGVVLDYRIVGSNRDGTFNLTTDFNQGRTATHEVGHFFGLRHIWGDDEGACNGEGDYVDDTPNQGNSSDGCPSHPQIGCNVKAMFQNYMDYTNDVCMNLYTRQQVERMIAVLENSPRRTTLLTSPGLYDPALVNNDLSISEILSPSTSECTGTVIPVLNLKNNGLNAITSAKIQLEVKGVVIETRTFSFNTVGPQEVTQAVFSPLTLSQGNTDFYFEILETNGDTDGKSLDNAKSRITVVPYESATPFWEKFNELPQNWALTNADEETTWEVIQTGDVNNELNKAVYMKFFRSEEDEDETDVIITPVIDLSRATSPFLGFDVAYARYLNRSDGLEVHALMNCSADLTTSEVIYSKYGSTLATVSPTTNSFLPANENQWRREVIDLSKFIGQDHIQFAFVAVNDRGNNLYLDNIGLRTDVSENIAIKHLTYPSPVQCGTDVQPILVVENKGDKPISTFSVEYFANNDESQTVSAPLQFDLFPGNQASITLPAMTLKKGSNNLSFSLVQPNGFTDVDASDNKLQAETIVDDSSDKIPLRKNFDEAEDGNSWQIINPTSNEHWQIISTNYDRSLYFEGDSNEQGQEYSWFVSPVLDFSDATASSLFFDISYQYKSVDSIKDAGDEVFKVLASRDCGKTFDEMLLSFNGRSLTVSDTNDIPLPASPDDWQRNFLNLNTLAGEKSVRIAFVVSEQIPGRIYLDNIEFFLSDNPAPFATSDLYSLYPSKIEDAKSFYVTFNLDNRQTVKYEMVDMSGRQVSSMELTDVLNQTYQVEVGDTSSGIYLVRLLIDKKYYVSRIVVIP